MNNDNQLKKLTRKLSVDEWRRATSISTCEVIRFASGSRASAAREKIYPE